MSREDDDDFKLALVGRIAEAVTSLEARRIDFTLASIKSTASIGRPHCRRRDSPRRRRPRARDRGD